MYPPKLNNIINLFESLPEDERRETLVSYADNARKQEPREGEQFDLQDIRKDEECADTVGVYLHVDENGKAHIRMTLGVGTPLNWRSGNVGSSSGFQTRWAHRPQTCVPMTILS